MDFDTTSSDGVKKNLNYFSIVIIIYFITDAQFGVLDGPQISLFGGAFQIVESRVYWLFVFLYGLFTYLTWRYFTIWNRLDLLPFIDKVPLIISLKFEPIATQRSVGFFGNKLKEAYQFTFVGKRWATHSTYYEIAIGTKKKQDTPVDIDSGESIKVSVRMQLTGIARVLSGYQGDVVHIPVSKSEKYFDLPQGVHSDDEIVMSMSFYKKVRRQVFTHTTFLADTFLPWIFPIFAHVLVANNFVGSILAWLQLG